MPARTFTAPLVINSTVALVAAVVTAALVLATVDDNGGDRQDVPARTSPRAESPQPERLAFVRQDAFASRPEDGTREGARADVELRSTLPPSEADAESDAKAAPWSTEVRVEEQPKPRWNWRFSLLPTQRPADRAVQPKAPARFYTLKARLAEISTPAGARLAAKFESAKVQWPPSEVALIAIKDEKALELHARDSGSAWKLVHRYRVLAASGGAGPKLRQGDKQVPEGIYGIAFLNPNSSYHVSLRVNYPNAFDRLMAKKDGRRDLGGDIMIHGKNLSAGCLAVGDEAAEELFVLAAQTGLPKVKLVIAPTDFREKGIADLQPGHPVWLPKLYTEIASAMSDFKAPRGTGLLSFFTR